MTLNDFCRDIDELLERKPDSTTPTEKLTEVPGWCSLSFMGLLALVDDRYGVALPPRAVLESSSLTELFDVILRLRETAAKAA